MSKIDEVIASAQRCPPEACIEVPISLWSPEEIEELYTRLPADLRINPEGRTPGCARIERAPMSPMKTELLVLRKIILDLEADLDRQLWDDEHVKSCRDNDIDIPADCEHHAIITQAMRARITIAVADMRDISNET